MGNTSAKSCRKIGPSGSSPHAWGTRRYPARSRVRRRFIPTCVGNTGLTKAAFCRVPVHPHMRGEHASPGDCGSWECGSSPHAWGTHRYRRHGEWFERFIPTCVGNTAASIPPAAPGSVHPHMRGEHSQGSKCCASCCGSSPHAWGTRARRVAAGSSPHAWGTRLPVASPHASHRGPPSCLLIPTCVGTLWDRFIPPHAWGTQVVQRIPTCVGNTYVLRTRGLESRAWRFIPTCVGNTASSSPHEQWGTPLGERAGDGSSPHAWGTRSRWRFIVIPTCVGNTAPALRAVHPHMRGEHRQHGGSEGFKGGHPHMRHCERSGDRPYCTVHPHMRGEHIVRLVHGPSHAWGTRCDWRTVRKQDRFIPTCVGNTFVKCVAVHPHMRGEHIERGIATGRRPGSSPHAWGTPVMSICPTGSVHPHMRGEHA